LKPSVAAARRYCCRREIPNHGERGCNFHPQEDAAIGLLTLEENTEPNMLSFQR
jgi:hypothetical protein